MDQPTFADLECQGQKRKTRRELFLERSDTAKSATGKPAKEHGAADAVIRLGQAADGEGKLGT